MANIEETLTHNPEVGFKHKIDRWISVQRMFKLSQMQKILSMTDFGLMEKVI